MVARQVREQLQPAQLVLAETETPLDVEALVAETAQKLVLGNIDIPRITMQPAEETRGGFEPFTLDLKDMQYQAPSQNLWIQYLREGERQTLEAQGGNIREGRLEDYIVKCLIDFNDICYDTDSDLLYDLASQTVRHLRDYLSDEDAEKVLLYHQRDIARYIHVQMQAHYHEEKVTYTAHISGGFTALKSSGYTQSSKYPPRDFRQAAPNKNETGKYVFNGFERCLYIEQKFDSDSERQLAVILDREAHKWFRPAPGQFQIFYSYEYDQHQYEPDFVAETDAEILMIEVKMKKEMQNAEVLAKKGAALAWCRHATDYTLKQGGKPWRYLLLPHHELHENMTLEGLGKLCA
jgi:type III restriction enzyme